MLSDSGTINESQVQKFPALNIREAHERPEAMEEAAVMMTGLNRISLSIHIVDNQSRGPNRTIFRPTDYNSSNVSEKVLRIVLSYCDYINRVVWKKY